jgi:tRNA modification GTPase
VALYSEDDTIVAVATAPGEAAIGLIRLSGPQAIQMADRSFRPHGLGTAESHRLLHGWFVVGDQDLDEVLVSVMRGPSSYTGEDTVEFSCHGGPHLLRLAVEALVRCGARPAERGEFTRRAFLNGKLDLTQAEAVADLIGATTDLGLSSAYFRLRGGLKRRFEAVSEDLRQSLTLIEAGLDFSEDLSIGTDAALPMVEGALSEIDGLISSYRDGKMIRDGARVTIAGKPNVGKSSLMNRLLEEDRAIVTPVAGTTRDTIEESVHLGGLKVLLVDTAGIRDARDAVEAEGTRRSARAIEDSDLVLLIVDGSQEPDQEDAAVKATVSSHRHLLVRNKLDLGVVPSWDTWGGDVPRCEVCALTGEGLGELKEDLRELLMTTGPANLDAITHERHLMVLERGREPLRRAREAIAQGLPGELAAMELREGLAAIGEVVGETTPEDILDRVFETFCIGK